MVPVTIIRYDSRLRVPFLFRTSQPSRIGWEQLVATSPSTSSPDATILSIFTTFSEMQSHLTCICMTYLFCLMRKGVRMKWRSDSNFCFLRIGLTCKSQLDTPEPPPLNPSHPHPPTHSISKSITYLCVKCPQCWKLRHSWSECNRLVSEKQVFRVTSVKIACNCNCNCTL